MQLSSTEVGGIRRIEKGTAEMRRRPRAPVVGGFPYALPVRSVPVRPVLVARGGEVGDDGLAAHVARGLCARMSRGAGLRTWVNQVLEEGAVRIVTFLRAPPAVLPGRTGSDDKPEYVATYAPP